MISEAAHATRLGSIQLDLSWTALEWPGSEHVIASYGRDGFLADSWLVMVSETGPARVSYQLRCDASWQVTALTVRVVDAARDRTLSLTRDPAGRWQSSGNPLPELDGCADVDINRSPLTNTLPIRRLGAADGVACDLDVVYVEVPELTVRPVRQRYTRLAGDRPVYRYESGTYSADLPVDGDGFVIDYPGLWRRTGLRRGGAAGLESVS